MAVLLTQVDWYGNGGTDSAVTLNDVQKIEVSRGAQPKSNSATILLSGNYKEHLDSSNEIRYAENDVFKIYAKYDSDNSGLDTSSSSSDLLLIGELKDIEVELSNKKRTIKLSLVDRTYTLLNRIWGKAYEADDTNAPNGAGWTAPEIIQDVIRNVTDSSPKEATQLFTSTGTTGVASGLYEIDARLESDGSGTGYIEDTRPSQGTADTDTSLFPSSDNTKFPFISIGKSFKPAYEWINDLSSIKYCNTYTEQDTATSSITLVVQRAMRYYVDEKNRFHWFYPTNTPTVSMTEGTTTAISPDTSAHKIIKIKGKKSVFDVVNFVIFRAGVDMNGAQILGYEFDPSAAELKPTYRPFVKIADDMKSEDIKAGNLTRSSTGDAPYIDYPAGYPVTPAWDSEKRSVANDSGYNTNFREVAQKRGQSRARDIIFNRSKPRWKIAVTLQGENLVPADLVTFNSSTFGISDNLRIDEIKHSLNKNGWQTVINIIEDEEEREQ